MPDDIELLDRCAAGDQDAFEDLVRKYQRPLYATLYRMVSNHEDAADLLQRTFLKAYTAMGTFERRSSFKTWLYQIAINLTKNFYRDRSVVKQVPLDDVVIRRDPKILESIVRKEARQLLRESLTSLPDRQRMTVILRTQENKSFAEIASLMDCSVGTAKANYHHGVQKLKRAMEARYGPGDEANDLHERTDEGAAPRVP